jgi:hypothetical protein
MSNQITTPPTTNTNLIPATISQPIINVTSLCQQRSRQLLYNIPPVRLNLTSPYPNYTQEQLNMRRKAEILKYNNASQSNRFTKAQQWALLVKGYSTNTFNTINNTLCNTDMIPMPTYASDIPGPVTYLVRDINVPLYNYIPNPDAYSILNNVTTKPLWKIFTENDIFFHSGVSSKLFTLYITENIDNPAYNFQFETPISLYVSGSTTTTQPIDIRNLTFNIQNVNNNILYNQNPITLQTPIITKPINQIPNVNFDISLNPQPNNNKYEVTYYAGFLTVSNIVLYTQPGYIYDFYLTITTNSIESQSDFYANNFTTNNMGVYCNISKSNMYTNVNTNINTPPYNQSYGTFSFTGMPV